jgi:hypothetical protein
MAMATVRVQVDESDLYRREAMGAFAHEVRTPLTSIRMVLELARRQSEGEALQLDAELANMLIVSIDDLQLLADDLQETSRLERGRLPISRGPCDLAWATGAAVALLGSHIALSGLPVEPLSGPWDEVVLPRVLAGFATAANRVGDGLGVVRFSMVTGGETVTLAFESGERSGPPAPIAADLGFGFFRSRQFVAAMGGSVGVDRTERHVCITVRLPLR